MAIPRQRIEETLALLCERHPKTFFLYQGHRKPLKVGIHNDVVLDQGINRTLLRRTLANYVLELGYLKSQKAGEVRIDLDGNPAGVVTESEAENARKTIATRGKKKKKAKPKQAAAVTEPVEAKPLEAKPVEAKPLAVVDKAALSKGLSTLREAARKRKEAATVGGGA